MPAVFEMPYTVRAEDIDGQGHVNNLEYIRWLLKAAVEHSTAQGWPGSRYRELGAGWVVRSHHVQYREPAYAGDEIVVRTWVSNFKRATSLRKYKIVRPADQTILVVAQTEWAFYAPATRVVRRIPPELASAFELVPEADEPQ